jgi:hypothetical protein
MQSGEVRGPPVAAGKTFTTAAPSRHAASTSVGVKPPSSAACRHRWPVCLSPLPCRGNQVVRPGLEAGLRGVEVEHSPAPTRKFSRYGDAAMR